jgi:hypothetical protein
MIESRLPLPASRSFKVNPKTPVIPALHRNPRQTAPVTPALTQKPPPHPPVLINRIYRSASTLPQALSPPNGPKSPQPNPRIYRNYRSTISRHTRLRRPSFSPVNTPNLSPSSFKVSARRSVGSGRVGILPAGLGILPGPCAPNLASRPSTPPKTALFRPYLNAILPSVPSIPFPRPTSIIGIIGATLRPTKNLRMHPPPKKIGIIGAHFDPAEAPRAALKFVGPPSRPRQP